MHQSGCSIDMRIDSSTQSTHCCCARLRVRNKLDKYYGDLDPGNVNKWLEGFGDLPKEPAPKLGMWVWRVGCFERERNPR